MHHLGSLSFLSHAITRFSGTQAGRILDRGLFQCSERYFFSGLSQVLFCAYNHIGPAKPTTSSPYGILTSLLSAWEDSGIHLHCIWEGPFSAHWAPLIPLKHYTTTTPLHFIFSQNSPLILTACGMHFSATWDILSHRDSGALIFSASPTLCTTLLLEAWEVHFGTAR